MRTRTLLPFILAMMLCPAAHGGSIFSRGATTHADPPAMTGGHLARVTAYWPGEDYYTNRRMSSTGARLRLGYCAVDCRLIPYGSLVQISGLGSYLAVDTGTAVISRKAARESGHTREERGAMVVDLFFPTRRAGELFSREGPKFALITWSSGAVADGN